MQLFGHIAWMNSATRHYNTGRAELYSHVLLFFAGLEYVITQLKSVVLSLGIIDRHLSAEQAVLLSRLEEEYQVRGLHKKFSPSTISRIILKLKWSFLAPLTCDAVVSPYSLICFFFLLHRFAAGGTWSGPMTTTCMS